jgi:hypothetical protein
MRELFRDKNPGCRFAHPGYKSAGGVAPLVARMSAAICGSFFRDKNPGCRGAHPGYKLYKLYADLYDAAQRAALKAALRIS